MPLSGQAKVDYQREYMRRRRDKNPSNCLEIRENRIMGYIYVIHCEGSTYYKIGITRSNVEGRLQALQTGCPHNLTIAMMFRTANPEQDEHRIHELLKDCSIRGEWYDLDPQRFCDVILAINPLMVNYIQDNPMMVGYVPPKGE